MRRRTPAFALVAAAWLAAGAAAEPDLEQVLPRGGPRGTTVQLTLVGKDLQDAEELLFYEPGLSVLELAAEDGRRVQVKLAIAPDCDLGEHCLRLRTRQGISQVRTFWVGPFGEVPEVEPNDLRDQAQEVALDVTVTGVVTSEDVDLFRFTATAGQRVSAELEGLRLGTTVFDPALSLLDDEGHVLATADDSALLVQDPTLSWIAPADGAYTLSVRDASYQGSKDSFYRLHLGTFPRPLVVVPAGGGLGETIEFEFRGDAAGPLRQTETLPGGGRGQHPLIARDGDHAAPSANLIRVNNLRNVPEVEPNGTRDAATDAGALPLALNGVIDEPGDADVYRFTAVKDTRYRVRVFARYLRSPLDSVLSVANARGEILEQNDDGGDPDSVVEFTAPADGAHYLRIHDQLGRGGPLFVYRVEVSETRPGLGLSIPRFGRDSQARQTFVAPQGNRMALVLRGSRRDFTGDVETEIRNLPEGITARWAPMSADVNEALLLLEAAADAPLAARLARVVGSAGDVRGSLSQNVEFLVAPPNNTVYYRRSLPGVFVGVAERAPFRIDLAAPTVPVVRNGTLDLEVVATRDEGFDAPITVRMLWNPPGVASASTITIPKGETRAVYRVNADGRAPVKSWQIAVLGEAEVKKQTCLVASDLTPLVVAEPFLTGTLEMAALHRGEAGELLCKLEQHVPFEGEAEIQLVNLPNEVTAPTLRVSATTTEIAFPVQTTEKSPTGKHGRLFCQAVVLQDGHPIVHNLAFNGTLRIDPPPTNAPANAPPPEPEKKTAAAQEEPAPAKRLSRLEQLRLEARQRSGDADPDATGKDSQGEDAESTPDRPSTGGQNDSQEPPR